MAKCLRCGAGAEWIEGKVKAEPSHDSVTIPANEDEAALMIGLGIQWLEQHAPHRLKKYAPRQPDQHEKSEA